MLGPGVRIEEKKNFVIAIVVWDFQVTKGKKKNENLLLFRPKNDALLFS